ncbi:MAG: helix-turn-helix domain-containing protein [Eubacterium sp.]|nr:helix-turn-helix domain-containing protein [Eubacterium sp.]
MQKQLLERLCQVTAEEEEILKRQSGVDKSLYTSGKNFVVEKDKMLARGKLIDIRPHTRFVHFPEHTHNYIEIIYMCAGTTTHLVSGERVVLQKGELLFLNPHARQEILPAGMDDVAINFIVLPEFFHQTFQMVEEDNVVRDFLVGTLQQKNSGMDYIHFQVSDVLPVQNLVENLVWSLLYEDGGKSAVNQMTMALLIHQLSRYTDLIRVVGPDQFDRRLMFSVLRYIDDHYKDGTLTELADLTFQPLTGLSRFIKKESGQTFQQLLMQKRLNQAAYLLTATKLAVEDVIVAVGYDNSSYFHRIFKERYGVTPKKYRDAENVHQEKN